MHCVAGDGVGILAGAVIVSFFHLSKVTNIALECFLGFGFGWTIFQALFMRERRVAHMLAHFPAPFSRNCYQ